MKRTPRSLAGHIWVQRWGMNWCWRCRSCWSEQSWFFVDLSARVRPRLLVDHAGCVGSLRPVVVLAIRFFGGFSTASHGWLGDER